MIGACQRETTFPLNFRISCALYLQTFELTATATDTQTTGRAVAVVQVLHGPSISGFVVTPFQNPQNADETLYRLQAAAFGASSDSAPFEYRFSYVRMPNVDGSDVALLEDAYSDVNLDEVALDDFSFSSSVAGTHIHNNVSRVLFCVPSILTPCHAQFRVLGHVVRQKAYCRLNRGLRT